MLYKVAWPHNILFLDDSMESPGQNKLLKAIENPLNPSPSSRQKVLIKFYFIYVCRKCIFLLILHNFFIIKYIFPWKNNNKILHRNSNSNFTVHKVLLLFYSYIHNFCWLWLAGIVNWHELFQSKNIFNDTTVPRERSIMFIKVSCCFAVIQWLGFFLDLWIYGRYARFFVDIYGKFHWTEVKRGNYCSKVGKVQV